MLKKRILTAIILLPIFLGLLFYLSPVGFASLTAGVTLWAAGEWTYLMGLTRLFARFIYLVCLIIVAGLILFIPIYLLLTLIFIWWCIATLLIVFYPRGSFFWGKGIIWRGVMGFLVLIPCWIALNVIRNEPEGIYTLLFLFVLIWSADIGAYFIGKRWGRTHLAERVSPGKTWQGVIGGVCVSLVVALITFWFADIPFMLWLYGIWLVLVTVLFSIVGDLFESMLKREAGLKDSGRLLPGHGGILDRIDSLTASAPIYLFMGLIIARYFVRS